MCPLLGISGSTSYFKRQLQFQQNLVHAIARSLVLGQQPLSILYSNLRARIVANSGLADTTNSFDYFAQTLTVQLPQSSIEVYTNYPQSIFTIGNASRLGTKVTGMVIPAAGFDSKQYLTDIMYVLRENAGSQSIHVKLLRNDRPRSFGSATVSPRSITVTCSKGNVSVTNYYCAGGQVLMPVKCDGVFQGVVKATCPYNFSAPVCAITMASSVNSVLPTRFCTVSNFDLDTISCDCQLSMGSPDYYVYSFLRNVTMPASVSYTPGSSPKSAPVSSDPLYEYRYVLGSIMIAIIIMLVASIVACFKVKRAGGKKVVVAAAVVGAEGLLSSSSAHRQGGLAPEEVDPMTDDKFTYMYEEGEERKEDEEEEGVEQEQEVTRPEPGFMTPSPSEVLSPSEVKLSLGRPSALEALILRMKEMFVQPSSSSSDNSINGGDGGSSDEEEERSTYVSLSHVYDRGGTGGVSYEINAGIQTALKAAASPRTLADIQ